MQLGQQLNWYNTTIGRTHSPSPTTPPPSSPTGPTLSTTQSTATRWSRETGAPYTATVSHLSFYVVFFLLFKIISLLITWISRLWGHRLGHISRTWSHQLPSSDLLSAVCVSSWQAAQRKKVRRGEDGNWRLLAESLPPESAYLHSRTNEYWQKDVDGSVQQNNYVKLLPYCM